MKTKKSSSQHQVNWQSLEDRCPNGFDDIYDHFTERDLKDIADSYKQLAGFNKRQVADAMKRRQP